MKLRQKEKDLTTRQLKSPLSKKTNKLYQNCKSLSIC